MKHLLWDSYSDDNAFGDPDSCDIDNVPDMPNCDQFQTQIIEQKDSKNEQTDEAEVTLNFEEEFRQWALKNRDRHISVNKLLSMLQKQGHLLAVDARTLLCTSQNEASEAKCSGSTCTTA